MSWAKIDDQFFDHPKARAAGKDGRALFFAGLCYCAKWLTDGLLPKTAVTLVAAMAEVRPSVAQRLVDVGLWHDRGDTYVVHDYLEWNPSAGEVLEQREKRREAGRRGGIEKARRRKSVAKRVAKPVASARAGARANGQQNPAPSPSPSLEEPLPTPAANGQVTHRQLFGALEVVFGRAETESAKRHYGKIARSLLNAGATKDAVVERGRLMLSKRWTDAGPDALEKHWTRLEPKPDRRPREGGIVADVNG